MNDDSMLKKLNDISFLLILTHMHNAGKENKRLMNVKKDQDYDEKLIDRYCNIFPVWFK